MLYIKVTSVSDNINKKAAFITLFPQFLRYQIENMKNAFYIFKSFDESFSSALQFDTIAARDIQKIRLYGRLSMFSETEIAGYMLQ